jgi:FtsZ-interacting cell division protein ZipA
LTEIRWLLLGIGCLVIAAIWWQLRRRDGQARPEAGLREPIANAVPPAGPAYSAVAQAEPSEWGVSPLEPLSIKTGDFDRVPVLDMPMMAERASPLALPADADPTAAMTETTESFEAFDIVQGAGRGAAGPRAALSPRTAAGVRRQPVARPEEPARQPETEAAPQAGVVPATTPAGDSGRFRAPERKPANRSELQKIISLRVCTLGEARWSGAQLLEALEHEGLAHGRYQVFHRRHVDGTSLFCIASLVEPGSFDLSAMPFQEFRGVAAFAVLPGSDDCVQTVEAMIATARRLAERLSGMVQDGKGMPLSPQRAGTLLEEVARFQALLA